MEITTEWDFFIAHASQDAGPAEQLYSLLSPSARVYLDTKSMRLGDDWDLVLRDAQRKAMVTVVLVSAATDDAFYQREEMAAAVNYARAEPSSRRLVPIYLDGFPPADSPVPYGLRLKHGLAISPSLTMDDAAKRLLDLVQELRQEKDTRKPGDGSSPGVPYAVDICACVDVGPLMAGSQDRVLRELLIFPHSLTAQMKLQGKNVEQVRLRIITFGVDVAPATSDSDSNFFEYPEDSSEAALFTEKLRRASQSIITTRALAALEKAMRSDWNNTASRVRHIITIWSSSVPPVSREIMDRIEHLWNDANASSLSSSGKRLLIYAPEGDAWEHIANSFNNTIWFPSDAGAGLKAQEFDEIVAALTMSV
jgi:hypothetical protein